MKTTTIIVFIVITTLAILSLFFIFSPQNIPITTITSIDAESYLGEWYSLYEIPTYYGIYPFGYSSTDCTNPRANYTLNDDGTIRVNNSCEINGNTTSVIGTARFATPETPTGKLYVSFFWPFESDYNIMAIDENYQWALIGTESRNGLWFLSRDQYLSEPAYNEMILVATNNGFNIDNIVETNR